MRRRHAEIFSTHSSAHQRITNLVQSTDQVVAHIALGILPAALLITALT